MRTITRSAGLRAIVQSLDRPPTICLRCAHRLELPSRKSVRQLSTSTQRNHTAAAQSLGARYFFANDTSDKSGGSRVISRAAGQDLRRARAEGSDTPTAATTPDTRSSPRLRRRDRLKAVAAAEADENGNPKPLPLDASSTLSAMAEAAPAMSLKQRMLAYLSLTKPRLAALIVLTTTASYSLYPVPSLLSVSATQTPSLSTLTLLFLTTGTFATVASANSLNMLMEPEHDAKMSRTRNRPLVRGLIRPRGAIVFAIMTALAGTGILWYGVNPTTAALGASNIILYAFVYTPMKRVSIINTWVGAVVGAIPPMMGWCAAGGHYLSTASPSSSPIEQLRSEAAALLLSPQAAGGYLLAALLFAWQFPHFNALSYPIRHEYAAAGYKMAVSLRPALNARVALRYALALFPVCAGLSYVGVTDNGFLITSSAVNAWVVREAWRFWRSGGGESKEAAKAARGLFWASVWHLPLVLVFAMAQKKGLWEGIWRGIVGEEDDGEEWEGEDEE
ncbi:hypothetical protein ANO11243_074410 [Dothideomycetidae sp. 11243]|nr:hypothetical protein ANO11243_074410 [fungal sp. No.11243]